MSLPKTIDELYAQLAVDVSTWMGTVDSIDMAEFNYLGVNLDSLVENLLKIAGSMDALRKDMMVLIMVSQVRSVVKEKMTRRMAAGGKTRLESIFSKYGFVTHRRDVPSSTPTIPRVLSLFPQLIYKVRSGYPTLCRVLGTAPAGLEPALCFPGGCAMIKSSNVSILDKWVTWYDSFCDFVHMSPKPNRDQMIIAQRFSRVDESDRV